jgi:hypothetical protein
MFHDLAQALLHCSVSLESADIIDRILGTGNAIVWQKCHTGSLRGTAGLWVMPGETRGNASADKLVLEPWQTAHGHVRIVMATV